jgi:hypothetical protein
MPLWTLSVVRRHAIHQTALLLQVHEWWVLERLPIGGEVGPRWRGDSDDRHCIAVGDWESHAAVAGVVTEDEHVGGIDVI